MIVETKEYEEALKKYLENGINYGANTIKNADQEDLEQLTSDSFFYGALYALEMMEKKGK